MAVDRLEALLLRFAVSARMFHSGPLCGIHDFEPEPGLGQLHLVRRGRVEVSHGGERERHVVDGPSLLFYPRPLAHRFHTDPESGADMACAHLRFHGAGRNPLAEALPAYTFLPLSRLQGTEPVLELLFDEAFSARCGRQAVVDRLFEVVLVHVLRELMRVGQADGGLLAGLADPQLARALVAMHSRPADAWSLESLAAQAGLSRSAFAASFRRVLGMTPGDYLAKWRVGIAQDHLRQGRALKAIAAEVGYGSESALSRAFKAQCQCSPREWKQRMEAAHG